MSELETFKNAGAEIVAGTVMLDRQEVGHLRAGHMQLTDVGKARLAELAKAKPKSKPKTKPKAKAKAEEPEVKAEEPEVKAEAPADEGDATTTLDALLAE